MLYIDVTNNFINKKDNLADDTQNYILQKCFKKYDDYLNIDIEKEKQDTQKVIKIKNDLIIIAFKMDSLYKEFANKNKRFDYYNNVKSVEIFCDYHNVCADIRGVILSFTVPLGIKGGYKKYKARKINII